MHTYIHTYNDGHYRTSLAKTMSIFPDLNIFTIISQYNLHFPAHKISLRSESKFLLIKTSFMPQISPRPFPIRNEAISDLFTVADESLFKRVLHNDLHVLQPLLPAETNFSYNLRPRHHNTQLPRKSAYVNDSCFITRMLYSNSY